MGVVGNEISASMLESLDMEGYLLIVMSVGEKAMTEVGGEVSVGVEKERLGDDCSKSPPHPTYDLPSIGEGSSLSRWFIA